MINNVGFASVSIVDNELYIIGGLTDNNTAIDTIQISNNIIISITTKEPTSSTFTTSIGVNTTLSQTNYYFNPNRRYLIGAFTTYYGSDASNISANLSWFCSGCPKWTTGGTHIYTISCKTS